MNTNASYALGIVLGNYLQSIKSTRDCLGGDCVSFPFEVLMPSDFNTKDSRGSYKNSLLNIEYLDLRNKLFVERNDNDRLLSVGYLKPKDYREESGIVINNTYKYGFSGSGYFHEAIDINISGSLEIEPLQGEDCVTNLMKRGRSSGNFSFCYIADLLFYNPSIELICKSAYRECVSIELPYLLDVVERLSPRPSGTYSIPNLRPKSINRLRDIAIEIESEDLVIAKDFMFLSSLARPQGKLIKRKLNLYRSKLGTESD
ncbi:hypothetical protein FLM49_03640 [Neptunomonas phycophila]|nr:hypothetical protein FLM49_03640 [Neptunomonas phycophila]